MLDHACSRRGGGLSGNLPCAAALCRFALAATLQIRVPYGAVLFNFPFINQSSGKFTVDVHIIIVELRFSSSVV